MNPSPLLLERYFFSRIALDANPEAGDSKENEVQAEVEVGQGKENPRRFQVVLRLKLLPPRTGTPAYTGEFHAVGFFRVMDGWPEEKVRQLVEVNGAALLYGAVREMVCNLTARGPWPALMMPSATFLGPEPETAVAARPARKRSATAGK